MARTRGILGLVNPQDLLFKAVFIEKRLPKHHLKEISISAIVLKVMSQDISIREGGLVVIGLSRILVRKLKYLQDECSDVVHKIWRKKGEKGKGLRSVSSKGITLGLDLERLYIDDQMISPEEFVILPEEENIDGIQEIEDLSFGGFNDISYVEEGRFGTEDSTRASTATEITQIPLEERREKRRKIIEDLELEFDAREFRENLRNTGDIVFREKSLDIRDELVSKLSIAPEILSKICRREMYQRESIEGVRDTVIMESYGDISFGDNINESQVSSEVVEEDCLDIEKLPERFVFNEMADGHSRYERSRMFLSLLNLLGSGMAMANQRAAYSNIECNLL
ncbi:uncharacterized protein Eint_041360 [Encephalitozoon intestinalis ATCC 50506]|uniref:Rad21/Rec8-like protein N-terminal domain-containing protein n=1 Tax=Encephalitozoon intestinalis (strain ATCC 50506) TaxID=876142 RepID=E0S6U0_ENCIT|nr:uncharacterized protein Eint_041360 [Encephalitozoon intestinalis ATCC 50506]ADM11425.2 hypothetical protein Eint_041360 [Encephalitozoon intestinalis ATCC 50506]UTX45118.1 hypothetical protein GPK93_04g06560 [Encephalitozoon intestinalis]